MKRHARPRRLAVREYRETVLHVENVRSDPALAKLLKHLLKEAENARALEAEVVLLREEVRQLRNRFPSEDEEPTDNERVVVPAWDATAEAPF